MDTSNDDGDKFKVKEIMVQGRLKYASMTHFVWTVQGLNLQWKQTGVFKFQDQQHDANQRMLLHEEITGKAFLVPGFIITIPPDNLFKSR